MESCEVSKFFNAISESNVTLESILHCCVLDEQIIKGLEGSCHSFIQWVTLSFLNTKVNTKVLHQTTGLTPN